jgi:hypothetical protein
MSYDCHITRRGDWEDEDGPRIEAPEWLAVVEPDPEMAAATVSLDGKITFISDGGAEDAWLWIALPDPQAETGNAFYFEGHSGEVTVRKPYDPAVRAKAWQLAQRLRAGLVGDDGEESGSDGLSDAERDMMLDWGRTPAEEHTQQRAVIGAIADITRQPAAKADRGGWLMKELRRRFPRAFARR